MSSENLELLVTAYKELAVIAITSIAPLGNPGRVDEHFIQEVKSKRSLFSRIPTSAVTPSLGLLETFDDALRKSLRAARTSVGYCDAIIREVLEKAIPEEGP